MCMFVFYACGRSVGIMFLEEGFWGGSRGWGSLIRKREKGKGV